MKRLQTVVTIVLLSLFGLVAGVAAASQGEIVVVMSKDRTNASMDIAQMRNIYLGKVSFWPDGTPVNAYSRPLESPAGIAFLKSVVHLTPVRFKHHWAGLKLSGQAMELVVVGDPNQLAARIATGKGAIGYLLASEAQALDKSQLRVVPLKP